MKRLWKWLTLPSMPPALPVTDLEVVGVMQIAMQYYKSK